MERLLYQWGTRFLDFFTALTVKSTLYLNYSLNRRVILS